MIPVKLRLSAPSANKGPLKSDLKLSNKHPPFNFQKRALIQIFDLNISDDDKEDDEDVDLGIDII